MSTGRPKRSAAARNGTPGKGKFGKSQPQADLPHHEVLEFLQQLRDYPYKVPHLQAEFDDYPSKPLLFCGEACSNTNRGADRSALINKPCSCDFKPTCLASLGTLSTGIWSRKSSVFEQATSHAKESKKLRKPIDTIPPKLVTDYLTSIALPEECHPAVFREISDKNRKRIPASSEPPSASQKSDRSTFRNTSRNASPTPSSGSELTTSTAAASTAAASTAAAAASASTAVTSTAIEAIDAIPLKLKQFPPPPGLVNLGATCYLNSLLQCLYQNVPFREGLYNFKLQHLSDANTASSSGAGEVLVLLQNLFANFDLSFCRSLDTSHLISKIGIDTGEQQDPQEFSTLFLDKIKNSFAAGSNQNNNNLGNSITDIFRGEFFQVIRCTECNKESNTPYYDEIRLPFDEDTDVETCLKDYFRPEILEGENAYSCERCGRKVKAAKSIEATKPPPVLSLQLLRYVYDVAANTKKKVKTKVKLSSVINIPVKNGDVTRNEEYKLVAVLNHIGSSAFSGHYICEAMDWGNGIWWNFNDEEVTFLPNGPDHMSSEVEELKLGSTADNPQEIDDDDDDDDGMDLVDTRPPPPRKKPPAVPRKKSGERFPKKSKMVQSGVTKTNNKGYFNFKPSQPWSKEKDNEPSEPQRKGRARAAKTGKNEKYYNENENERAMYDDPSLEDIQEDVSSTGRIRGGGNPRRTTKRSRADAKKEEEVFASDDDSDSDESQKDEEALEEPNELKKLLGPVPDSPPVKKGIRLNGKGSTPVKKKPNGGSEDAYMLMYAKTSELLKYAKNITIAGGITPNEDTMKKVAAENDLIENSFAAGRAAKDSMAGVISNRKNAVQDVLKLVSSKNEMRLPSLEDVRCDLQDGFSFVRSDWLREYATGVPVATVSTSSSPIIIDADRDDDSKQGNAPSSVLAGATQLVQRHLRCKHGGVHPTNVHTLKMLPQAMYSDLIKAVAAESGLEVSEIVDDEICEKNYKCGECESDYRETLKTVELKMREWSALIELLSSSEPDMNPKTEADKKTCFRVASTWITSLKQHFKKKCAKVTKDNGSSQFLTADLFELGKEEGDEEKEEEEEQDDEVSEITAGRGAGENARDGAMSEAEVVDLASPHLPPPAITTTTTITTANTPLTTKKYSGKDLPLDEFVNSKIICPHSQFVSRNRAQYKYVSAKVWKEILKHFPNAQGYELPASKQVCEKCTQNTNTEKASQNQFKDWYSATYSDKALKALNSKTRKITGYPTEIASFYSSQDAMTDQEEPPPKLTLHLVSRQHLDMWRLALDVAKSGSSCDDFGTNFDSIDCKWTKCACENNLMMIPDRLCEILKKDGKVPMSIESPEFPLQSLEVSGELLTEGELTAVNESLSQLNAIRGDASSQSMLESLNKVTISHTFAPKWQNEACDACMEELKTKSEKDRKSFVNKKIIVVQISSNGQIPGMGGGNEVDEIVDKDDGGVLGVLGNTRRSSRNGSSGARGRREVTVSSSDMLGKLRLNLYQEHGFSPVGQHLYYENTELTFDDNQKTLASFGIKAGCTVYLQNDKLGSKRADKEKHQNDEDALLSQLFTFVENSDGEKAGSKRVVERGFQNSWLTSNGSGASREKEIVVLDDSDDEKPVSLHSGKMCDGEKEGVVI